MIFQVDGGSRYNGKFLTRRQQLRDDFPGVCVCFNWSNVALRWYSAEDRNGVQRLSPLSHSPAPIVQKGGLIKAFPQSIFPIGAAIRTQLEVFYQFTAEESHVV